MGERESERVSLPALRRERVCLVARKRRRMRGSARVIFHPFLAVPSISVSYVSALKAEDEVGGDQAIS